MSNEERILLRKQLPDASESGVISAVVHAESQILAADHRLQSKSGKKSSKIPFFQHADSRWIDQLMMIKML